MDLKRLNTIIDDFIINNRSQIIALPTVIKYCKEVLEMEELSDATVCPRNIGINESIKIVYDFLSSIDDNLASQYYNILRQKDSTGKPIVNIIECEEARYNDSRVENKRVYVYYDNTIDSTLTLLHEMLHKMNECNILLDNVDTETNSREFFGELVSISGEFLLGKYLLDNNYINESEYNGLINYRIRDAKLCAKEVIVQKELIDMRLKKLDINYDNSLIELNKYDKDSIEYKVLEEEKNTLYNIRKILESNKVHLRKVKRYVLAQAFYKDVLDKDMFLKLHYEIGNPESDILKVYSELLSSKKNK